MECTQITKEDARVTRWLQNGTTDLGRHSLTGLQVEKNITVSANGFTLRVAPTPPSLQEYEGQLIKLDNTPRAKDDLVKVESLEDESFPDWEEIIPKDKPTFEIVLNGGLLAALIENMKSVKLEFYGKDKPVVLRATDRFALLMPMHFKSGVANIALTDPFQKEIVQIKD